MRQSSIHRLKKLSRDPFMLMIAVVVMVPALLVVYGIANQSHTQSAVNGVSQEAPQSNSQSSSDNADATNPQPITQAEQPLPEEIDTETTIPTDSMSGQAVAAAQSCDQAKKQAAEATRNSQRRQENHHHAEQKDLLSRLVSVVYRKRWDEEKTRHNNALNQIEADYKAALAAANC